MKYEVFYHPDIVKASGKALKQRVLEEYNWDNIVEKTLDLYKEITS